MSKYLKFWGTRGSCPVSGESYAQFGGNTSCLEIAYDNAHLIIDAGTGIRPLGEEMVKKKRGVHIFLSHTHWDHLIGLPFFEPLYDPEWEVTIWGPSENNKSCREIMDELLSAEFFPIGVNQLKAKLYFHSLEEKKPVQIGPLTLHMQKAHHPSTAFCFKIQTPHQTIGYASDNEMFKGYHGRVQNAPEDARIVSFLQGCDVLAHEAQYFPEEYHKKVGWGHSSATNAIALIQKAKIGRWLVIHHDPKHTDADLHRLAALSQKMLDENKIPCRSEWIGDGYVLPLT